MRETIDIRTDEIKPERDKIFATQGIAAGSKIPEEVETLLQEATDLFMGSSEPKGVISGISVSEFAAVYKGEGLNENRTPLEEVFESADHLALFAVTVGARVTDKIDELFKANEFALGSMLDSAASAATDETADSVENRFLSLLSREGKITPSKGILRFSPGYCGWHMSGQKKLFEFLHPEDIGIELLDSYLMKPLKSISGVLVAGEKEIFDFEDSYPFCSQCTTRSCRERIKMLHGEFRRNQTKGAV
jgi:hypothetical protein